MSEFNISAIADKLILADPIQSEEIDNINDALHDNKEDEYFESVTKSTMETFGKLNEVSASKIVTDWLYQNPTKNEYSDFMNSAVAQSLPIPIKQDTFGGIRSRWRVATHNATRGKTVDIGTFDNNEELVPN